MRIAFIIDHLRPDGTQQFLIQLTNGLAHRGHDIMIVCLNNSWDDSVIRVLRELPVDVRIVGKAKLLTGVGLLQLWIWIKIRRFDVLVTMLYVADVLGRLLARAAGINRIVTSLRARNVNYSRFQRWLVRATINSANAVVLNTSQARHFAITEEGALPERIHVISNGVSVERFSDPMDQSILRSKLGLPKVGWVLGTVGRLTKQKGIDVLLNAVSLVQDLNFHLIILGTGSEEGRLRILADKLNIASRVHFEGYRRDLPELLGALDLYVHPARFEGMPNAVLEAMAAACPIVATAVDGICDLIEDGEHGWLVPAENQRELAKSIDEALCDRKEAFRRGRNARERARTRFSIDAMIDAWETMLVDQNEIRS